MAASWERRPDVLWYSLLVAFVTELGSMLCAAAKPAVEIHTATRVRIDSIVEVFGFGIEAGIVRLMMFLSPD